MSENVIKIYLKEECSSSAVWKVLEIYALLLKDPQKSN